MAIWQTGSMKKRAIDESQTEMVKTTLRLPAGLWRTVRMHALSEGRDAQTIVALALTQYLKAAKQEGRQ
jgi:hypothetical protein